MTQAGRKLRTHYVGLGLLPSHLASANIIQLRSTRHPRAAESLHYVCAGLYPPSTRAEGLHLPVTVRSMHEEDMIPGTPPCARLNELKKGFDGLKAACWSGSPEMARLRHILRSVRPSGGVTVDDIPKLRDTAQCLGKACPPELLQEQALIERINVDMFQSGYYASREYSALGIGPFLASVAQDMVEGAQQRKAGPKAAIYLAHDSTILATLAGIGGHTTGRWPGFGSSVKMEMFRASSAAADTQDWRSAFYVRVIYNDVPVVIPACAPAGNHLKGHITFCTLAAFKAVVDKITPEDREVGCRATE